MSSTTQNNSGRLNLLFIRHGETQDNIDRVLQGWRDTALTEKGLCESELLAEKLRKQSIDAIYHSPLIRIKQTIKSIILVRPLINMYEDADLRGQCLGELEGGSYDLVDLSSPRSADGEPGVECFDDFVRRLKRVLSRIIGAEAPNCIGGQDRNIVIATHGVGITSLLKALENTPDCQGFNRRLAVRGPEAFEVRWPDSDDVAKLVLLQPGLVAIENGHLDWNSLVGEPFLIERWGKKEKAL